MRTKAILITLISLFLIGNLSAKSISGAVSDESNVPMPGVSIIIKGTGIGSVTNIEGKYTIEANENDILIFGFIGMIAQEIKVKQQSIINVILKAEDISLNEVVVCAYGISKQQAITGSAAGARVKGRKFKKRNPVLLEMMDCEMEEDFNTEGYSAIHENGYKQAVKNLLSRLMLMLLRTVMFVDF